MPTDKVDAVHRLVAASKQAGGTTYTDKDVNIITDDDNDKEEDTTEDDLYLYLYQQQIWRLFQLQEGTNTIY